MHIPTHILSGWCAANCFALTARERLLAMVAAAGADLDGVTFVFGEEAYWRTHHVLAHNLWFGMLMSAGMAMASAKGRRLAMTGFYLGLFHLHLVMDYFGSGPNWPVYYLWPVSNMRVENPTPWELTSWQNRTAFAVVLAWTVLIAVKWRRTPVEVLAPRLDQRMVGFSKSVSVS